ncbi:MAG: hypothetical protein V3V12_00615 [Gammaproteobacteria bacterium]
MTTNSNTVDFKQRERDSWASAAAGWSRRDDLLRRGAAPVTERMLELARIAPGQHILDIASGTGSRPSLLQSWLVRMETSLAPTWLKKCWSMRVTRPLKRGWLI